MVISYRSSNNNNRPNKAKQKVLGMFKMTWFAVLCGMVVGMASEINLNLLHKQGADCISFTGVPDKDYEIEFSGDLLRWKHCINISGTVSGTHTNVVYNGDIMRFYRVKEGKASVPTMRVTLDASSPMNRSVAISSTDATKGVTLAVFDLLTRTNGTLVSLDVILKTSSLKASRVFTEMKLAVGSIVYVAEEIRQQDEMGIESVVSFRNISIPLAANVAVPVRIVGDIDRDSDHVLSGEKVSVDMIAGGSGSGSRNNPCVLDQDFNTIEVEMATISAGLTTLVNGGMKVRDAWSQVGPAIVTDGVVTGYQFKFFFTVGAGEDSVYLSTDHLTQIMVMVGHGLRVTLGQLSTLPGAIAGDGTNYRIVPAQGEREFVWQGIVSAENGVAGTSGGVSIMGILFGKSPTNLSAYSITRDLDGLRFYVVF